MQTITIIDYGMGNLWSVKSALEYLNYNTKISNSPSEIEKADCLILPGVGSFRLAMKRISYLNLDKAITNAVKIRKRKILGICLGIQLMSLSGKEDGDTKGLSLINLKTNKFDKSKLNNLKIPHIGFNSVIAPKKGILYKNIQENSDFYFVHSYCLPLLNLKDISCNIGVCNYGYDFIASYEKENIFATQFHPEKSQTNGLILLKKFFKYIKC